MRSNNRNSGLRKKMDKLDYQIYHPFKRQDTIGSGVTISIEDQGTNEFVSEKVKTLISQLLPGEIIIKIYDCPKYVGPIYGVDIETIKSNRNLLYIHYFPEAPHCGGGKVLIIDKDSLEVIYNGPDGME